MSRVKRGPTPRRRKNRVFDQTEGFVGSRGNRYWEAVRSLMRSWEYAYAGRKDRKRDFRALWITRINAASRLCGMTYSTLIDGLNKAGLAIDRKVLADLAVHDMPAFTAIAEKAKASLAA